MNPPQQSACVVDPGPQDRFWQGKLTHDFSFDAAGSRLPASREPIDGDSRLKELKL